MKTTQKSAIELLHLRGILHPTPNEIQQVDEAIREANENDKILKADWRVYSKCEHRDDGEAEYDDPQGRYFRGDVVCCDCGESLEDDS